MIDLEALRLSIGSAKLVYDVIQSTISEARIALQFVCRDSLVTDTPTQARDIAFGSDRHRAVSLDGTLFQTSGVISGGGKELRGHANKWNKDKVLELKAEKEALINELRELKKTAMKEIDVETKRREIQSLEKRLTVTKSEIQKNQDPLAKLEHELEYLKSELSNCKTQLKDKKKAISELEKNIRKFKEEINQVEDKVFRDFCKTLNIKHIRFVFLF